MQSRGSKRCNRHKSLFFWAFEVPLVSAIMKSSVEIFFPYKISADMNIDYLEDKEH